MKKFLALLMVVSVVANAEEAHCLFTKSIDIEHFASVSAASDVNKRRHGCKCFCCVTTGCLLVTGNATVNGLLTANNLTVNNILTVNGSEVLNGDLAVDGAISVTGDLSVGGDFILGDTTLTEADLISLLGQLTYGFFSGAAAQVIAAGAPILFATAGAAGGAPITGGAAGIFVVPAAGNYEVSWTFMPVELGAGTQFQVFVNGAAVASTNTGAAVPLTEISASVIVAVPAGALTIEVRNITVLPINGALGYLPTMSIERLS